MGLFKYKGAPGTTWVLISAIPEPGEAWEWPDGVTPSEDSWEPAHKNAKVTRRTHPTDEPAETPAADDDPKD